MGVHRLAGVVQSECAGWQVWCSGSAQVGRCGAVGVHRLAGVMQWECTGWQV